MTYNQSRDSCQGTQTAKLLLQCSDHVQPLFERQAGGPTTHKLVCEFKSA